jgi:hypothetical protein
MKAVLGVCWQARIRCRHFLRNSRRAVPGLANHVGEPPQVTDRKYNFADGTQLASTPCPSLAQKSTEPPRGEGRASQLSVGMSARGIEAKENVDTRRSVEEETLVAGRKQ